MSPATPPVLVPFYAGGRFSFATPVIAEPESGEVPPPWQFDVTNPLYGAVGNGQLITDAVINSSSASLTTLSSTPFTPQDAGKYIIVNGAGNITFNGPLITTITTYVAPNQVTLNTTASTSVSGACAYWGTDDTPAFNSAVEAAAEYMAGTGMAQVYRPLAPNGLFYMIAGPLITAGSANAQIPIPNVDNGGSTQKQVLLFSGEPAEYPMPFWSQEQAQVAGACVSTGMYPSEAAYQSNYGANGDSCVIGSTPNYANGTSGADNLPPFSNIHVICQNWTTVCPANDYGLQYTAISLAACATGRLENCTSLVTKNYNINSGPNKHVLAASLQNGYAKGLVGPANGNNDEAIIINPTVSGFAYGLLASEHTTVYGGRIIQCCFTAGLIGSGDDQTTNAHFMKFINLSSEDCTNGFFIVSQGAAGFSIDAEIDTEGFTAGDFISDGSSGAGLGSLYGEIRVYGHHNLNIYAPKYPISFTIKDMTVTAPGWIFGYAGFTTAGSGVAVQNPYWRAARIYVSGGSVTAITAGVTLGGSGGSATTAPVMDDTGIDASPAVVDWPSGGWLAITYSSAPAVNVCVI